jgi:sporulation protein YlmC with PRC-barrel domain
VRNVKGRSASSTAHAQSGRLTLTYRTSNPPPQKQFSMFEALVFRVPKWLRADRRSKKEVAMNTATSSLKTTPFHLTEFTIGTSVSCRSGPCGKLTRLIIDPVTRMLTHIVVEPKAGELGRLVPLRLVEAATTDEIALACTLEEFDQFDPSRDSDYFPMDDYYGSYYSGYARGYGYDSRDVSFWPYYGYGGSGYGWGWEPQTVSYEAIPQGEVTIRRGDPVHATDGDIGKVEGLVIGTPEGEITHVLLQEGHLWKKKDVAIPIHSVTRIGGTVQVNLTKDQLKELPEIDIDRPETIRRAS